VTRSCQINKTLIEKTVDLNDRDFLVKICINRVIVLNAFHQPNAVVYFSFFVVLFVCFF